MTGTGHFQLLPIARSGNYEQLLIIGSPIVNKGENKKGEIVCKPPALQTNQRPDRVIVFATYL